MENKYTEQELMDKINTIRGRQFMLNMADFLSSEDKEILDDLYRQERYYLMELAKLKSKQKENFMELKNVTKNI